MVTMLLLVLLGAMFLRGFREVIAIAVVIVGVYLAAERDRDRQRPWLLAVSSGQDSRPGIDAVLSRRLAHANTRAAGWLAVVAACLLFFPKLALGLSGFETGVAVMPLVKGDRRRSAPPDGPHPQHAEAARHGGHHHVVHAARLEHRDGDADRSDGADDRRAGGEPGAGVHRPRRDRGIRSIRCSARCSARSTTSARSRSCGSPARARCRAC